MQTGSLSFLVSVFFSLSVLILWFPQAFLNQEVTSHSWHLQEALETSGDRLSGCREASHCMGRARAVPKLQVTVFFFRANLLFFDDFLPVTLGI